MIFLSVKDSGFYDGDETLDNVIPINAKRNNNIHQKNSYEKYLQVLSNEQLIRESHYISTQLNIESESEGMLKGLSILKEFSQRTSFIINRDLNKKIENLKKLLEKKEE